MRRARQGAQKSPIDLVRTAQIGTGRVLFCCFVRGFGEPKPSLCAAGETDLRIFASDVGRLFEIGFGRGDI